jgi:hypothetical protein
VEQGSVEEKIGPPDPREYWLIESRVVEGKTGGVGCKLNIIPNVRDPRGNKSQCIRILTVVRGSSEKIGGSGPGVIDCSE